MRMFRNSLAHATLASIRVISQGTKHKRGEGGGVVNAVVKSISKHGTRILIGQLKWIKSGKRCQNVYKK